MASFKKIYKDDHPHSLNTLICDTGVWNSKGYNGSVEKIAIGLAWTQEIEQHGTTLVVAHKQTRDETAMAMAYPYIYKPS